MDDFLGIYLRDQLALGVGWRELARRAQRRNDGTELGAALFRVATAIAEDVETFRSIMRQVGARPNPVKTGLAIGAERLGRLKLNGRFTTYSPLSRFVELEFLAMGIEGKTQLWTTLRDLAGLGERLPDINFDHLIQRAEHQRAELEPFRRRAGTDAFGTEAHAPSPHPDVVHGEDLRRLLDSDLPDPVLVLSKGRATVVATDERDRAGLEIITRTELLRRTEQTTFTDAQLDQQAAQLSTAVNHLGG